ncbi:MAG: choice-of-anchor N protein [Nitrospiraceae bacterium]|nr:choice-of-anchor N protein [Nitrospiraceae bacterium]
MKKLILVMILIFAAVAYAPAVSEAYPALQLYIDGATYDSGTATWSINASQFDIWVIGDLKNGSLYDVKLTTTFYGTGGTISFTPKTTSKLVDPSVPSNDPDNLLTVSGISFPHYDTGLHPVLPAHGIFNSSSTWADFFLGDFTKKDSPIGDFMTSYPASFSSTGQINVYEVNVSGWDRVHFDAYGFKKDGGLYYTDNTTYELLGSIKGKDIVKAPFSHDAVGNTTSVPEPGTLILLGAGLFGLGLYSRKRNKN